MNGARSTRAGRSSPGGASAPGPGGDGERWTVLRLIRWSADYLGEKGVESPRLDAEHLLAHALGLGRLQLYLQYDRPLTPEELDTFRPLIRRRARREPLQYILGRAAFRELDLVTDRRALIPRPETEVLVERVLEWSGEREGLTAVDVGTGTGCIALSLAHEGPFREVWAVDLSAGALSLARENARAIPAGERVRLVEGDGLASLPEDLRVDVVVSNPPYVSTRERDALQPEVVEHEPHGALFAGPDGLEILRALVAAAPSRLRSGGLLALEVGAGQTEAVMELVTATGAFTHMAVHRDLTGRPRFVTAERRDAGADH